VSDAIKVTYKPEGVEPRMWTVDLKRDVRASEYIAMQKVSGLSGMEALGEGLSCSDVVAIKALLWLLLKRDMSTLSWDSLDFTLAEIDIDTDDEPGELRRKLELLEARGDLSDAGRRALDRLILDGVEAAVLPDEEQVGAGPKA
jgi:hypothetical protein